MFNLTESIAQPNYNEHGDEPHLIVDRFLRIIMFLP